MLLERDATINTRKRGLTPTHAGLRMGLASNRLFSFQVFCAASDSKNGDQTQRSYFLVQVKPREVDAHLSGKNDWLPAKQISIQ